MNICMGSLRTAVVLAALATLAGCSSQDFGRPMGRYSDVIDSGRAYVADDSEDEALRRAERLSRVLLAWDRQRQDIEKDYFIGSDDGLSVGILALDQPGEVSSLERTITKGGLISLPLVGDIEIAGLSTRDAERKIAARYDGKYLKDPQITVEVSEYRSQPVMITGMISTPGVYYLRQNQSSVLEILSQAGGLASPAGNELHIFRRREVKAAEAESESPAETETKSPPVTETQKPAESEEAPVVQPEPGSPGVAVNGQSEVSRHDEDDVVAKTSAEVDAVPDAKTRTAEAAVSGTNLLADPPYPVLQDEEGEARDDAGMTDFDDSGEPEEKSRSFFARLFGRGKKSEAVDAPVDDGNDTVEVEPLDDDADAPQADVGEAEVNVDDADEPVEEDVAESEKKEKRSLFARLFGRSEKDKDAEDAVDSREKMLETDVPSTDEPAEAAVIEETALVDADEAVAGMSEDDTREAVAGVSHLGLESETIVVDLKELLEDGDVRQNVPVYGGDIISIPAGKAEYVYVMGYVQHPGAVDLRGKKEISALHAVSVAGGLSTAGRAQNTVLYRDTPEGRRIVKVDLTKIVRGARPPVYMEAGDTLIVGSSIIGKLAEFIRPTASVGASLTPGIP